MGTGWCAAAGTGTWGWQLWEDPGGLIPRYSIICSPAARPRCHAAELRNPRNAGGEAAGFLKYILQSHWEMFGSPGEVGKPQALLPLPPCSRRLGKAVWGCCSFLAQGKTSLLSLVFSHQPFCSLRLHILAALASLLVRNGRKKML